METQTMTYERLGELMEQALDLERGPTQLAMLEEAMREADTLGDVEAGFNVRMELIESATFAGYHEKSLVAFSWCLSRFDEDPESFDEFDLLWKYKWILNHMPDYVHVSKQQIINMQNDMERRFLAADCNLRPVHYMRWSNFMRMGDFEKALEFAEKWRSTPRDWLADCEACEQDHYAQLMIRLHRNEEALQLVQPILDGEMSCAEIPHMTLGNIIRPLLRLNRLDEARKYFEEGYRLIRGNREFIECIAEQMLYCLRTGALGTGMKLLDRHLVWAVDTFNLEARFRFYVSAALLLDMLAEHSPGKRIRLRLPDQLPCRSEDDCYRPAELAEWFEAEAEDLATRFNERNGNDYFSRRLAECCELVQGNG